MLKVKRVQKQQRDDAREQKKQQMQAQTQFQSQEIAAQKAMEQMQMKSQMEMQSKQAEVAFDIERLKNEAMLKAQLMDREFQYNLKIKGIDEQQINNRERDREDAKSSRISQQNSEQSQLINQRKNNLPPMSFESNEDTLDGFDLSEFDPR